MVNHSKPHFNHLNRWFIAVSEAGMKILADTTQMAQDVFAGSKDPSCEIRGDPKPDAPVAPSSEFHKTYGVLTCF